MKNDADLAIRIPQTMLDALKKEARFSGMSAVVRNALAEYLERKGHNLDGGAPTTRQPRR